MNTEDLEQQLLEIAGERLKNRPRSLRAFEAELKHPLRRNQLLMQLYGVRLTVIVSGTIFDARLVERELLKIVDAWVEKNPPKAIEPLPPTAPPEISESPHPPTDKTAETSDTGNPATMKRAALVGEFEKVWPSIDRDLRDASENGLSDAAKSSERGWWRVDAALQWAKQRGKLSGVPRTSPATSVFDLAGKIHRS